MLIWSMVAMTALFLVLGVYSSPPNWLVVAMFGLFAIILGFVSNLEFLYAAELFPTDIRGSGVGLASAGSRIGAVGGTYLLPVLLSGPGLQFAMLLTFAFMAIGLVVSVLMAPETKDSTLYEAGTGGQVRKQAATAETAS